MSFTKTHIIQNYLPSKAQPKRLVVLGAGESGYGTAILAKQKGYDVFVSDKSTIAHKYEEALLEHNIEHESGTHTIEKILNADIVMKSPGIPDKLDIVKQIRERGILVVSEIEFASWFTDAQIVGITGSNGKTTVSTMVYQMLKEADFNVGLGGNIGKSFAYQVATEKCTHYVLEISSFQLDDIYTFRPDVAVLTNITPDHLDRYNYELQNYIASKFNISKYQTSTDFFIYCQDDEITMQNFKNYPSSAHSIAFSQEKELSEGAYTQLDQIIFNTHKTQLSMSTQELGTKGRHNVYNSMAAGIVGSIYGLRKEQIRQSLTNFKSLEHRLETVSKVRGVEYINDSKATNVNSTWYALESMSKDIIWIAGGVDKGNDYVVLEPLVKSKVKAMICLGVDNHKLHAAFGKYVDVIINVQSMNEAVQMAYQTSKSGDAVLLSPACASFDLFENYEDRGQQFKSCVYQL
jgi:UDP-N-acetylmuramoylalanine--D-glutamate ligase